jgi:6-phosphogluconolactonase
VSAQQIEHGSREELRGAVVTALAEALRAGVTARGQAVLAVSGGKSPVPVFEALSAQALPWDRVTVTLVDERFLPTDHPDSNEALVRRHLLQREAAAAGFIGLRGTAASLDAAAEAADRALADLPGSFDAVVLGMGEDGHTASWFPDGDRLAAALDRANPRLVMPMLADSAAATRERLTLTLPVVVLARLVLLPLEGDGKLATLRRALEPGPPEALPIRAALKLPQTQVHTAG